MWKTAWGCMSILMFCLAMAGSAQGAPLNLVLEESPDIMAGGIDVVYTAANGSLVLDGDALTLYDGIVEPAESITNGTFNITATVDLSGNVIDGSINIGGTFPRLGFNSGTLLTGDLTAFGFPDAGGDPLEFLFAVSGGDAAPMFGPYAGGSILSFTWYPGSFEYDWDNNFGMPGFGNAMGDTAPVVPEPCTVSLLVLGALFARRRKRIS